jgi:hypothetical protein
MFSRRHASPFLGILLLFATVAQSQKLDQAEIRIVPPNPSPKDEILARLSGVWHNGCIPRSTKVSIAKQVVRIQLQFGPEPICPAALTPWSLTASVGRLREGDFQIDVFRETGPSIAMMGRTSFSVSSVSPKRRSP